MAGSEDSMPESLGRITVALVSAQISEVKALVDGQSKLMEAGFKDVQRQLDAVGGLPVVVNGLIDSVKGLDKRVAELEEDQTSKKAWRLNTAPAIAIGVLSFALAAATFLIAVIR